MASGVLFVMIYGAHLMLELSAVSWDTLQQVNTCYLSNIIS